MKLRLVRPLTLIGGINGQHKQIVIPDYKFFPVPVQKILFKHLKYLKSLLYVNTFAVLI